MRDAIDVEFDLHGLAGIAVRDGSSADVAAVRQQLGPIERPLGRPADIVLRFVDHLPSAGPLRLLGDGEFGHDDRSFFVLRGRRKARVRVQLPLERIGETPLEIRAERGATGIPLLIPILNLTALVNHALPLHGAAFRFAGQGVLVTGWSKGGKSEALLTFVERGAEYVADEWVYLPGDGQMVGIPEPVRVWDWHLRELPSYEHRLTTGERYRLRTLAAGAAVVGAAAPIAPVGSRRLRQLGSFLETQRHVDLPPARLFDQPVGAMHAPFDRLVFVVSHTRPETTRAEIDPMEVADRMTASLRYERQPLWRAYQHFLFCFPGARNSFLETVSQREHAALRRAFAGKPSRVVCHPYPVGMTDLYDAIAAP